MRIFLYMAALAIVAGCSGGGSQPPQVIVAGGLNQNVRPIPPRVSPSHERPFVNVAGINALRGNHTFVADAASETVTIWGANGQLNGILFDGLSAVPTGLATDAAQNLYVANLGLSNVIIYAKPYTSIKLTLNDAQELTMDVAVRKGLVAVTNYLTVSLDPGSVSFFAKNSTQPCRTVQDSKWVTFVNDAFDASGNLFIDGQDASGATLIGEVSGGCNATAITTLSFGNTISNPGGVQVSHGNILVGDVDAQTIYTYAPPVGGSLGSPTAITKLAGAGAPVTFAMEESGQEVRTADRQPNNDYAALYKYPKGSYVSKIGDHITPAGVAVYPPARP